MSLRHPSAADLEQVGVRIRSVRGVVECVRCGASWQTLERAGEPLRPGYWMCPHGCNVAAEDPA